MLSQPPLVTVSVMNKMESSILNALNVTLKISNTSPAEDTTTVSTLTEQVDATVSDKIQLEILKLLKDIQNDTKDNKNPSDTTQQRSCRHKRKHMDTSKYC